MKIENDQVNDQVSDQLPTKIATKTTRLQSSLFQCVAHGL